MGALINVDAVVGFYGRPWLPAPAFGALDAQIRAVESPRHYTLDLRAIQEAIANTLANLRPLHPMMADAIPATKLVSIDALPALLAALAQVALIKARPAPSVQARAAVHARVLAARRELNRMFTCMRSTARMTGVSVGLSRGPADEDVAADIENLLLALRSVNADPREVDMAASFVAGRRRHPPRAEHGAGGMRDGSRAGARQQAAARPGAHVADGDLSKCTRRASRGDRLGQRSPACCA